MTIPEQLQYLLGDRYHVEDMIGSGGMAIVYRAKDRKHDRPVAIKVMRPEIAAAMGRERFLSEISIAARLQHPHILALIDSGDADGLLFYVMPFLEGETLAQRLAREGRLSVDESMRITNEVVSALRHAHEHGVLHRDIKPSNVMLTGGHAVVMDFGIARAVDSAAGRLTATGMLVGTPSYMGPEHLDGKVDTRSDIYAVGCVLYEMLAGSPPFTGPTAQAILLRHLTHPVPALSSVRRDVPRHVELILMRALAKQPADRFPDMPAFHAELQLAATGSSSPANEQVRRLPGIDSHPPSPHPRAPANPEAYDTYLRGIHSFDKRTEQGNERAISLLERAVSQDPTFAPALAALGAAYVEKFFTYDPDEEWEERAFVAIEKARAIDPGLAKIYVVKGSLLWTRERRFPHEDAIDEFRRALAIDSDNVEALNELGKILFHVGRLDEAVRVLERTLEIDSAFINSRFRLALAEMLRGNYARSLELLRMLPVGSHGSSVPALSALNLHYLGRTEEGRRILERSSPEDRNESDFSSIEAIFFALDGNRDAAEKSIAAEIEVSRDLGHFHHAMCYIAAARAIMGETDAAIEGLARAADEGFPCYPWFERDPCLESVRSDPRFVTLITDLKARFA
ncbi:MAG: protein kinase [Gemmatimonadaceae bacterium]|nr:protein kinase [Gemmatimonadaceae bacterium]